MSIIITGASGFVGQNLVPSLRSCGDVVIPLSLRENSPLVQFHERDAIIHLAGKAHDTANTSHAQEYFAVNTELTKQLFERFLASPARDFIYFSSVKAVADAVDGVLDENMMPSPQTPYGQSKLKAEEYLLSRTLPPGKRIVILRPCMIHGPGNKGNLNLLYQFVHYGIPYPLGAFDNFRSFTSIENLCFVVGRILNTDIPSGVYNVADDKPLSTKRVIKIIADEIGKRARTWNISRTLISRIASLGDIFHLPLNSERMRKLTDTYVVSNQKLITALKIHLPVDSEMGMKKTIRSFIS